MGQSRTIDEVTSNCDPVVLNSDISSVTIYAQDNTTLLDPAAVANPCGLIAKSLFTDTYAMSTTTSSSSGAISPVIIDSSNIAWKSDVEYKFKNLDQANYT
jgi:hypothetical protein